MRTGRRLQLGHWAVAAIICAGVWPAAQAKGDEEDAAPLNVKLGYDRTRGTYGANTESSATTTSATVTYDTDNYSLDLVLPYLTQTGPGRLVTIAGRRPIVVLVPGQKVSGMGDVTAGLTRYWLNEEDHGFDLDLGATIKFPTASASKGLGTGKSDLAVQAALGRSFGPLTATMTVGYTFVGKPAGQDYHNASYASLDVAYKFNAMVSAGLTYAAGNSVIAGLPGTRDVTAYVNVKPTKRMRVEAYVLSGRSTQSPDHGAGLVLAYDF